MTDEFRLKIQPAQAQQVYDFWLASHKGKPYPAQSDLDLMTIPRLVPNCFILDVVNETRFRYRFVGTAIENHLGRSLTGFMVDEVRKGKLLETLTNLFSATYKKNAPASRQARCLQKPAAICSTTACAFPFRTMVRT